MNFKEKIVEILMESIQENTIYLNEIKEYMPDVNFMKKDLIKHTEKDIAWMFGQIERFSNE